MRDAAAAAAMSDPENNRWFRRRWSEHPAPPTPSVEAAPGISDLEDDLELLGRDMISVWRLGRVARKPEL